MSATDSSDNSADNGPDDSADDSAENGAEYLAELGALLRAKGLPDGHVTATVADLTAHLAETGTAPEDEFGPAAEFAAQLAPAGDGAPSAPETHVETWRWVADTYVDEALLNRFGDEGWEVERVDALGRFVSHRDPEQPQRWEYRRELISVRGREGLDEKLAPDGWEACGSWLVYAWFKRPKAASMGPAAALAEPPPAPARRSFRSRRSYPVLACLAVAVVVLTAVVAVREGDLGSGLGFATGLVVGAAVPVALIALGTSWAGRRCP